MSFRQWIAIAWLVSSCGMASESVAVEFAAAKSYPVGGVPQSVASGDLNGDGKTDLVVANPASGNVSVLLGNDDGTFRPAINFATAIPNPQVALLADFNGDGKLDVVVFQAEDTSASLPGAVSVLLGNGDGTFQTGKIATLPSGAAQIAAADLNHDGKADLLVLVNIQSGTLALNELLGNGDGTFHAPSQLPNSLPCGNGFPVANCSVFAVGDFNHDGKTDLIVASGAGLQTLLGNGDGTFRNGSSSSLSDGYTPGLIEVADFNGDGVLDLVVTSGQSSCAGYNCHGATHYSVLLGKGDGSFQKEQIFGSGSWSRGEFGFGQHDEIDDIFAADLDGDGKLDIVDRHVQFSTPLVKLSTRSVMQVRLGNGDGTFGPAIEFPDPGNIALASDLDGDKLADLVVAGPSSEVQVLINDTPTSGADVGLVQPNVSANPVGLGQSLTYSVLVLDEGPENATSVTFTDALPSGATFVSARSTVGTCSVSNLLVTCRVGSLAKGASAQISVVIKPATLGAISNTMNVTATETDGDAANNSATQMTTVKAVRALTAAKAGTGSGTVTSGPGLGNGLNCGNACSEMFLDGTVVQLAASPDPNSTFDSWSGACTGDSCELTMDSDKTVTATFDALPDFTMNPTSANLTLPRGGQTSETISFPAVAGFKGNIAVTCSVSGKAPVPICSVSPSSVAAGSSVTLQVAAPNMSAALVPAIQESSETRFAAVCVPFAMFACLFGLGLDKKRGKTWMLCLLLLMACILPAACGGGSSSKPTPQSYVVTVTGASGSITHTITVNVTVGQ